MNTANPMTKPLLLEALKLEHTISAPRKGVVKALRRAPRDRVSDGVDQVEGID